MALSSSAAAQTPEAPSSLPTQEPSASALPPPAAQKPSAQSSPPAYKLLRDEEDWSYLRDSSRRTDFWDPIKYIRLREGKEDWYLTIGGEARPYYERFRNEDWGRQPQDSSGYLLQRYMLHSDLHLGKRVRFFVQFKSGLETGRTGGPRPPDEDQLDINQAFVDVLFEPGKKQSLVFRAGRQELNFGSGRLVAVREAQNVRFGFDALRAIWRAGAWRVDGFAGKPVKTDPGFFDDDPDSARTFWGVYAVRPLPAIPKSNMDIYYFGLDRKQARFDQGAAREQRQTLGVRFWNKDQAFDYDWEFAYQLGKFGRGDIGAWSFITNNGYTFRTGRLKRLQPRIGVETGVVSGDNDPRHSDLQTFNPLFPRGAYFGQIRANGALNVMGFRPRLTLQLTKRISFSTNSFFFWRQSLRDGLYSVAGNLLRTGQLSRARYIGTQPEVEAVVRIDRHTTFTINYARFLAGPFLRETPPGRDITYFATWVTYRF